MNHKNFQDTTKAKPTSRHKIIKKYGNRKLYDTQQSSYVVLKDIEKMIRNEEQIRVIDNETQSDITIPTLTQIIFGAEKKSNLSAPIKILQAIIKDGDGSFSSYLANLGLFKAEIKTSQITEKSKTNKAETENQTYEKNKETYKQKRMEAKDNTEQKIAKSISLDETISRSNAEDCIPQLPGSSLTR